MPLTKVNQFTVVTGGHIPDRIYMRAPGRTAAECRYLAARAVSYARPLVPKMSGAAAKGLKPYFTSGSFGIRWDQSYLWYQEAGIRAFTMSKIAGKIIPMWVDDTSGDLRRKNPKIKQRTTASGKRQVLIFRKASKPGERKRVAKKNTRGDIIGWRDVPKSYPGAPGRIGRREYVSPNGTTGRIARPNVGVRWRHPGLEGRAMLQHALQSVAADNGIQNRTCYATFGGR